MVKLKRLFASSDKFFKVDMGGWKNNWVLFWPDSIGNRVTRPYKQSSLIFLWNVNKTYLSHRIRHSGKGEDLSSYQYLFLLKVDLNIIRTVTLRFKLELTVEV